MDWIVSPPNPYFESLTHNVTVFGDRDFELVIKVKWGHKVGALIWQNLCPYKRKRDRTRPKQRRGHVRTQQEGGHLRARKKGLTKIQPLLLPHWSWPSKPPELWENSIVKVFHCVVFVYVFEQVPNCLAFLHFISSLSIENDTIYLTGLLWRLIQIMRLL